MLYEKSCYVKAGAFKDLIQEVIDVRYTAPRAARDKVLAICVWRPKIAAESNVFERPMPIVLTSPP